MGRGGGVNGRLVEGAPLSSPSFSQYSAIKPGIGALSLGLAVSVSTVGTGPDNIRQTRRAFLVPELDGSIHRAIQIT